MNNAAASHYVIGLDYGTESARGVLLDAQSGKIVDAFAEKYPHGVITKALPTGEALQRGWALQVAADYTNVAEKILTHLGRGRHVKGIGVGFTASSPMPVSKDGAPLSNTYPHEPHAYVKLWKHGAAQSFADEINKRRGSFLDNFGGKLSGEWLLPKAAQLASEASHLWSETHRFIEGGDWLVWQLTGQEARSLGFAAYKAQYSQTAGYPDVGIPGMAKRLSPPSAVGSAAGELCEDWLKKTGILGPAVVAVSVIDSHVVLPAIGAVTTGCLVGALGTSAVYMFLSDTFRPLPRGIEGVAWDGSMRNLWCYEAGQAGFGDTLAWFVNTFPRGADAAESFKHYNSEAALLKPGANHLFALDWWNGNRVPHADSKLSGLMVGLTTTTTAADIYRALIESLCFGARSIYDLFVEGGFDMKRLIFTSGLAQNNPLLVQIMADVIGRTIEVPQIEHATAVGAAIHGAVAAKLVPDYGGGAARFGASQFLSYHPNEDSRATYEALYQSYKSLSVMPDIKSAMHSIGDVAASVK